MNQRMDECGMTQNFYQTVLESQAVRLDYLVAKKDDQVAEVCLLDLGSIKNVAQKVLMRILIHQLFALRP